MTANLTPDGRTPMIIHAVVLRTLHEAFWGDPSRYMSARGALRWLASRPFDEVDSLAGFLHTPPPTNDDFIRGATRIHPSVFEEIERAFAEGRNGDGLQALDYLLMNQIEQARQLLDLSSYTKPRQSWHSEPMQTLVHRAIENLVTALRPDIKVSLIEIQGRTPGNEEKGGEAAFKVRSLRPVLYHIRSLYANGLNDTADAALNCLLNGDLEGAKRAVSGIAPGDMEIGGFAGRQIAAQLDMEDRHRGNRRTNEAPDAQQAEAVYQVPAGKLSKLREIINAAADVKVGIHPTMLEAGEEGRIAKRAYINSQVLIHNALRIVREIIGEEKSDGAQTNCAQGPEDEK